MDGRKPAANAITPLRWLSAKLAGALSAAIESSIGDRRRPPCPANGPGSQPRVDHMIEPLDETEMTEITIQPDGRVYVFGASLPILQILQSLQPNDPRIVAILGRAKP